MTLLNSYKIQSAVTICTCQYVFSHKFLLQDLPSGHNILQSILPGSSEVRLAVGRQTLPWSGCLKLGIEQRAAKRDAQSPFRPCVCPKAAGPSLSACSTEPPERPTPQAQTVNAQAHWHKHAALVHKHC